MLTLTSGESSFLQEATERFWKTTVEIVNRTTGAVVKTIETTADDVLDGEKLAVIGGTVQVDTNAEVLRTLSLELVDPFKELTVGPGQILWLDKLIKVYKGYKIPSPWGSGAYTTWPLGVFLLNGAPEIDATGGQRIIRLQAGDKTCLANGNPRGRLKLSTRIAQGTAKKTAIQTLAQGDTWVETLFNLTPESTVTVPFDLSFPDVESPWAAAQRVNEFVESGDKITHLYYDPYGYLTLAVDPGPDLVSLPSVWTIQPMDSGPSQLVGAKLVSDLLQLRNAVRVKWGSDRYAPGSYMAYDNDAASSTYVGSIGWLIHDWKGGVPDELIRNLSEATARANYEKKRRLSYQERIPMTILEHPALEPWDVVSVTESQADINAKYQLLSFSIDLGASGVMQAEAWRVRSLV